MSPPAMRSRTRLDAGLVRRPIEARAEREARPRASGVARCVRAAGARRREPGTDVVEPPGEPPPSPSSARPPSQAAPVRRSQAIDPVVERETEERQALVVRRRASAAARGRGRGRRRGSRRARRGTAARRPGDRAASASSRATRRRRDREGIGAGRRRLEDRHRIGGQVRPARVAAGPGALEQGEAGQVAERLGHVDRRGPRRPSGRRLRRSVAGAAACGGCPARNARSWFGSRAR